MTTAPQTIKEFFAQYTEKGYIFPNGGLRVMCRYKELGIVAGVYPAWYGDKEHRLFGVFDDADEGYAPDPAVWSDGGKWYSNGDCMYDIVAVLDDTGNVIAGTI